MRTLPLTLAAVLVLSVAAVTGGCLPSQTVRDIQTYRLSPVPDVPRSPRTVTQPLPATLLVSVPKARPGFDTARMAYVQRPHEVSYYAYNQWVDTPARMLAPSLVQSLEQSGIWSAVALMPTIARGTYRLDADALLLQQEFLDGPSQVHLALRAQLIDLRQQCVMGSTDFDVLEPAPSDDPYGGVVAANQAARKLLEQLVAWVATYMNEGARHGCDRSAPASGPAGTDRKS